jgi:hypothetical protein
MIGSKMLTARILSEQTWSEQALKDLRREQGHKEIIAIKEGKK